MSTKLYLVTTQKEVGRDGEFYVIAEGMDEAYSKVRNFLDSNDICFTDERELKEVSLVAEDVKYPDCSRRLLN